MGNTQPMLAYILWFKALLLAYILWFKALHVIAVIAWMAATLYLFRLYVYHAEETEPVVKERLTSWENRLHERIGQPAMIAAVGFGTLMLFLQPALLAQPFMQVKLAAVVGIFATYGYGRGLHHKLVAGAPVPSERSLRLLNELPMLFIAIIVAMIIVRPWIR